jgi:FKBP-type peptidyl-prolyl cis-trans isomerase FklB
VRAVHFSEYFSFPSALAVLFTTLQEKTSYLIGRDLAANFTRQGLTINVGALAAGLQAALAGEPSAIGADEARAAMTQLQQELQAAHEAKAANAGEDNRREGQAFLAKNSLRPEVTTLPSGLQYEVLRAGTGPKPTRRDSVTTHYHGMLLDGTVFDSSIERNEPASFPVGGVIAGWTEALQLMGTGAKWRLYIPSDLAYGTQGAGGDIGPNATLVFDVELLRVN